MTGGRAEVRSADGTTIGYRRLGSGPAVLLLHGGMLSSQHFSKLAAALSADFTVCVPDRRGRGLSGPHGDGFSVSREVEDVRALVAETGATRVFGLSSGALVALRTALVTPALERIALYEPPLSVGGSVPVGWLARFDREVAAGRSASALVTGMKGLAAEPSLFSRVPRFALVPLLAVGARLQREGAPEEVSVEQLIPTLHFDLRIVGELADTAEDYAGVTAPVLLLGGSRSAGYLRLALAKLADVLPHARRVELKGAGHSGPEDDGVPLAVARELRGFFATT
ncbi:alpha/beta hydrolase [Amycolatopsis sp. OK19-0408]|uniref:Alpha/beta hydrolase n=1 Tax=Amycolatopsis iheyensis TaxID=2945988 RepID=A0A9X2NGP0_9PSEU|nr:alpha/beta hydrolase [Amycolatopsis iheyensis]MCR6487438.1 alpha/beta hydrolase [Amycolatopsis iheyensis]